MKKQVLTIHELKKLANTECGNNEVKKGFSICMFYRFGNGRNQENTWLNIDDEKLITRREKSGIAINIKLSISALTLLGKRGKADENVFDLAISDTAISKNLKHWVKKAEIDKSISFYCGRHTYAVLLLMNGANLKTCADAMAQTSTQHTIKYLNYVDSLKDEATSNLP